MTLIESILHGLHNGFALVGGLGVLTALTAGLRKKYRPKSLPVKIDQKAVAELSTRTAALIEMYDIAIEENTELRCVVGRQAKELKELNHE